MATGPLTPWNFPYGCALDGRLTYDWQLILAPSGSVAQLTSTTEISPSFTADQAGTYRFQLRVQDVNGLFPDKNHYYLIKFSILFFL